MTGVVYPQELVDAVAEILATLKRLPAPDRLDVAALATRAALDAGLLDAYRRTPNRPAASPSGEAGCASPAGSPEAVAEAGKCGPIAEMHNPRPGTGAPGGATYRPELVDAVAAELAATHGFPGIFRPRGDYDHENRYTRAAFRKEARQILDVLDREGALHRNESGRPSPADR